MNSVSSGVSGASEFVTSQMDSAREGLASMTSAASGAMNAATSPELTAPGGFFDSNSVVAKFTFLITVLIVFAVAINFGTSLVGYISAPSANPYIVKGMISGSQTVTVSQNPRDSDSVSVLRSSDQPTGLEFTWSVWLLVEETNFTASTMDKKLHVFNKGNSTYDSTTGKATVSNGPGMYISRAVTTAATSHTANLECIVDLVDGSTDTSIVAKIPLGKWFHVAMRAQNNVIDVYINGTIAHRASLAYVPLQNYYNIYVCQNGGFNGKLSNLRYFSRALSAYDINSVVSVGPSLVAAKNPADARASAYYMSDSWFAARQST
jgi:hypothetical protein